MYGALTNNQPASQTGEDEEDIKRRPSEENLVVSSGSSGNRQAVPNSAHKRKRARIYSHCHVQQDDDNQKAARHVDKSARRRLIVASVICLLFMIGEVVGGVLSNSLAIATDAAHLLTDFASFMISLFAIWLSSRPASRKMSFGWYRAEVIGALLSVLMIWLVTGLLVYMAVERLRTQQFEIDSLVMVITASAGLLVNIIMALALNCGGHGHSHGHFHSHGHSHGGPHQHDHHQSHNKNLAHHHSHQEHVDLDGASRESDHINKHPIESKAANGNQSVAKSSNEQTSQVRGRDKDNINVRAAFIHVIGDFLQSLGVLIAALVIHFAPDYKIVDPICTFLFSIIVLATTIRIIRDAINVLMEGIPDGIDFVEVRERLQSLPGVIRVHNLRIWSLSLDKIAISTHLVIDNSWTPSEALNTATDLLRSTYNFLEVTIQVEEYKEEMKDCEKCQDEGDEISVVIVSEKCPDVGANC